MRSHRKNRRPGNRGMTVAESAHVDAVKRAGCLCCLALGFEWDHDGPVVEAHHVLSGGLRIGHGATLGLCLWHHKGRLVVEGWNHAEHRRRLGPSLAEGAGPFHDTWGEEQALLVVQAELLRLGIYTGPRVTLEEPA